MLQHSALSCTIKSAVGKARCRKQESLPNPGEERQMRASARYLSQGSQNEGKS
jgi:hypothetical protein